MKSSRDESQENSPRYQRCYTAWTVVVYLIFLGYVCNKMYFEYKTVKDERIRLIVDAVYHQHSRARFELRNLHKSPLIIFQAGHGSSFLELSHGECCPQQHGYTEAFWLTNKQSKRIKMYIPFPSHWNYISVQITC